MAKRQASSQRNLRILALAALLILALGLATLALTRPLPPAPTPAAAARPTATQPAPQTTAVAPAPTPGPSPALTPDPSPKVGGGVGVGTTAGGLAIATPRPNDRMRTIRLDQLPAEAHDTLRLIAAGGPFPYHQDGAVFENREGRLPRQPAGYYREYTVVTPGSADRGARRLVRGHQGELYYTDDHYNSFRRVIP